MNECNISSSAFITWVMSPLTSIKGVGKATSALIARATGGSRVIDLLFHLPNSYIDRSNKSDLIHAKPQQLITFSGKVIWIQKASWSRQPSHILISDETATMELIVFSRFMIQKIRPGMDVLVSGKPDIFMGKLTIHNPDYIQPLNHRNGIPAIEPVWPLTTGLYGNQIRKTINNVLDLLPVHHDWFDKKWLESHHWPTFITALRQLHAPATDSQIIASGSSYTSLIEYARSRLAYDEMLANQIATGLARHHKAKKRGRKIQASDLLEQQALRNFSHCLTTGQLKALEDIKHDLNSPFRMLRLLQGDVGSGKTIIALLAMLYTAEAGAQAALMAPTETLAKQHYRLFTRLSPIPAVYLGSSVKGKNRLNALNDIEQGSTQLIIGTHALFQEGVRFHDLALTVIDEQHRFGVDQRLMLGEKGRNTNILAMTATPIPRTLLLTKWGEMSVTLLTEKPAYRKPVFTTLHSLSSFDKITSGLQRMIDRGALVFWVCPLIAENEMLNLMPVEERYQTLCRIFGTENVTIAHGQQDNKIREKNISEFSEGHKKILVSTTVIEVGVDIPLANVMVVDHAEQFGLAQLHQLRGRVGRGKDKSYCLFLHEDRLSPTAKRRLTLLRKTQDGFLIADEDYKIRGGGDIIGRKQSGAVNFRIATETDLDRFLTKANRQAHHILQFDPNLTTEKNKIFRDLLTLFSKDDASRLINSG